MTLRLHLHQTAPTLGAYAGNLRATTARVEAAPSGSLVVFPELSLTGYDLGMRARELAISEAAPPPLRPSRDRVHVVFGFPEEAADGRLYNTAAVVDRSGWVARHRKRYLPTYGMFDEGRIFAPGTTGPRLFHPHPDWPAALLICEEFWHPALVYLAAMRGARLLVVTAAAPGRGRPHDPKNEGPRFRSHGAWRLLARSAALTHGVYVALANRVGVEGGTVFAGGSLVVTPDGEIVAEASHEGEDVLEVMLDPDRLRAARAAYSHLRDEDAALVVRELQALLEGGEAT
ncbi:MAG: nitrilase-related carbon-nitrogen hydrolase [Longimicrobiales bacterium]|nr:nitrilase-related carbon-nitrogen hydrolase [Longimicrobiales bacterium]